MYPAFVAGLLEETGVDVELDETALSISLSRM
jgi:hypothetical protein